jgi:hypothetical protein
MTVPRGQLRECCFVLHPFRNGAEGNKEELEVTQLRMAQPVRALGEHKVRFPQKHQGKLLADLPIGTRSAHLAAFGRLDESQRVGGPIAGRDVEGLPNYVDEVLAREPLKVCHQAIVSASAHTSRTVT